MHILNFIIAHEFGHIVHGHLLVKSSKGFVEEFYNESEILQNEEKYRVQILLERYAYSEISGTFILI